MHQVERLRAAADELCAAAILGDGWESALTRFAVAAGAQGAVVMSNRGARVVAEVHTGEIAEAVADFVAGRAPPSSRQLRVVSDVRRGFRVDHDDYTPAELSADPYYQDFLRPIGYFWHANVTIASGRDQTVDLSLKRHLAAGAYDRADAMMFDAVLPELRAAARLAHATFRAETRGMRRIFEDRGHVVFELGWSGAVLAAGDPPVDRPPLPVTVIGGRLRAFDDYTQAAVERAVAAALAAPAAVSASILRSRDGSAYLFQVLPVPGVARDVFGAAKALAVLIAIDGPHPRGADRWKLLRSAFGLTGRESDVATMLVAGLTLPEIASRLRMRSGTVRTHLKHVFEKTSTRRQAELVALLSRLIV